MLAINRFPLIIDVVPSQILNNPGAQELFIIKVAYLLREFGRAASKFLVKSINVFNQIPVKIIEIELKSR